MLLGFVLGCGGNSSREFAVTTLDGEEVDCTGVTNSPAIGQETVDAIAKDARKAWEMAREMDPPTRVGQRLWVNELALDVEAWFEPRSGAAQPAGIGFDSSEVVYRGRINDDYIEAEYADVINGDAEDEDLGRELCGDRVIVAGVLTVTDGNGIEGRVRWTENTYIGTVPSSCLGWVSCVRDIRIEGLEVR
jgi:hypothetical protein